MADANDTTSSDFVAQARLKMLSGRKSETQNSEAVAMVGKQLSSSFKACWNAGVAQGNAAAAASKAKHKMTKGKAIRSYMWGMLWALFFTFISGGLGLIVFGPLMFILTICLVYRLTAD